MHCTALCVLVLFFFHLYDVLDEIRTSVFFLIFIIVIIITGLYYFVHIWFHLDSEKRFFARQEKRGKVDTFGGRTRMKKDEKGNRIKKERRTLNDISIVA